MKRAETDFTFFDEVSAEIISDPLYITMKNYVAHAEVSVYDHSVAVARRAYGYAVRKKIKCDLRSLVRGALLHDFFLYDWHKRPKFTFHGYKHAKIALKNAEERFSLNDVEKDVISSHMFPLNLFSVPRTKEAWIVTMCDKICAAKETFRIGKNKKKGDL
ncbi:MAG: HD domain-containing protein [Clostridia bacterium]|nr:HD domain-containing protein [Clostridia bacterium]